MKPFDHRLLGHAHAGRTFIMIAAGIGTATAGLLILQADLLASVISRAFLHHDTLAALAGVLSTLVAVVGTRSVLAWLSEATAHRASATVLSQLRTQLVDHVLHSPPRATGRSPAELATLATTGVDSLEGYFSRYLPQLLMAAVVPATVAARILAADWTAALIVAATVPLIPLFMILIGLYTRHNVRRQWRTLTVLAHHFIDLVAGLAVLTAFGRAKNQAVTIREITERYRCETLRTLRVAFLSALVLELVATLSVALVAVSVGLRLVTGHLELQTALVVLILAPEVYLPLRAVGARFHDSAQGLAAAEEIFAVLDLPRDVEGGRIPAPDPSRLPLRVHDVRVNGRAGPILDDLNLTVEPGHIIGLVGPSGAGKTTVIELLLSWRRPDIGRVAVGNVDLADIDRSAWLARVAWVPQQPCLLRGTVADNLRLARPSATTEQLQAVADQAALDLPLDAAVGELGAGLSTGQQRRVALARALLADRPLLLLDEPTEGVDEHTESAIVTALPAAFAGRTVLIATHRPALLRLCDRVVSIAGPATASSPNTEQPSPAHRPDHAAEPARHAAPWRPAHCGSIGIVRWWAGLARPYVPRLLLASAAGTGALASGVALSATSAWLISTAALRPPVLTLMVAIVAVRAFGLSKGVLRYAERLISHDVALRLLGDVRVRVWQALVRLGPAASARLRRGELLSRLVADVDAQQEVLIRGLLPAASALMVATATGIGLGLVVPGAGLALFAGVTVAGLVAPLLAARIARAAQRRTDTLRVEVLSGTVELLQGAPDLRCLGAVEPRQRELAGYEVELTRMLRRCALARGAGIGLTTLAVGLTAITCAAVGIVALAHGLPGPLLAVLTLTPLAMAELVSGLPESAQRLLGAGDAARRLAALEQLPSTSGEPAVPHPMPPGESLRAVGLAVRWPDAAVDTVSEINLAIAPRRRLAVTGPSGCGKSTVLAALMRTLDPSAGAVYTDELDTLLCASDEVRSRISWCGPNTHLFDSTLRENLRLAAADKTDGELIAALHQVRLGGWFDRLPEGLDTRMGAHGSPVSGGERQRLGLARALLADRPIWLLDEPTAHLDDPTATALAHDLLTHTADRAALIVTHRPGQLPGLPLIALAPRCTPATSATA